MALNLISCDWLGFLSSFSQTQNFCFLDKITVKLNGQIGYYRSLPDKPLTKINKRDCTDSNNMGFDAVLAFLHFHKIIRTCFQHTVLEEKTRLYGRNVRCASNWAVRALGAERGSLDFRSFCSCKPLVLVSICFELLRKIVMHCSSL